MGCGHSKGVKITKARILVERRFSSSLELYLPSSFVGEVTKWYVFGPALGYGQYGTVRLAHNIYHPEEQFAIKTISFKRLGTTLEHIRREIAILFSLDHPNIIRLYEVYEEAKYFHLVTEYCSGGELFDRLVSKGHYPEAEAAFLLRKILGAVSYLHSRGVCHRDLKPENFMFESGELKLIDFGLAAKVEEHSVEEMHSQVGTAFYVAPEVLKGKYNFKCDIWSVGIILYLMITGTAPYPAQHSEELFNAISTFKLDVNSVVLSQASPEVRDLLSLLLSRNPDDRPTAQEALNHPWFSTQQPVKELRLDPMVLFSLKRFRATSRLKAAALTLMAKRMTVKKMQGLSNTFAAMDTSSNGLIEVEELEAALEAAGFTLTKPEVTEIMSNVDLEGTGQIKYSDFIAATLASKSMLSEEMIRKTFMIFDTTNSGFITRVSLQEAMARTGRVLTDDEAAGIIAEADVSNQGKINFTAFKQILRQSS